MNGNGKIFVCGDLHGGFEDTLKLSRKKWPEQDNLTKNDVVIQLGDFGYIWYHDLHQKYKKDQNTLKDLSNKKFTLCFVDGNHENFELLYSYPEVDMFGSKVREVYPGIYWLQRGHIYTINGKTFFVMGGAKSNANQKEGNFSGKGRNKKLKKQKTWWAEELPSQEELELGRNNLIQLNWNVDYVVSHTCPTEIIKSIYHQTGICNLDRLNDPISLYFDEIEDNLIFKEWHFGHHHCDLEIKTDFGNFLCHYKNTPYEL